MGFPDAGSSGHSGARSSACPPRESPSRGRRDRNPKSEWRSEQQPPPPLRGSGGETEAGARSLRLVAGVPGRAGDGAARAAAPGEGVVSGGGVGAGAGLPHLGDVAGWLLPGTREPTPRPQAEPVSPRRARPSRDVTRRPRLRPRALGDAVSQQLGRALCRARLGAPPGVPGRGRRAAPGRGGGRRGCARGRNPDQGRKTSRETGTAWLGNAGRNGNQFKVPPLTHRARPVLRLKCCEYPRPGLNARWPGRSGPSGRPPAFIRAAFPRGGVWAGRGAGGRAGGDADWPPPLPAGPGPGAPWRLGHPVPRLGAVHGGTPLECPDTGVSACLATGSDAPRIVTGTGFRGVQCDSLPRPLPAAPGLVLPPGGARVGGTGRGA
nr:translation initiation factor IF-2-like [Chlorocebus sabaeus]